MTPILIVGTGRMARVYVHVLQAQGVPFIVVGRSDAGVQTFTQETTIPAIAGGVKLWAQHAAEIPQCAILAVDTDQMPIVAREVMAAGIKRILLEKPGALTKDELSSLAADAETAGAELVIGYNRRYLAAVEHAKEMIAEDGGATSLYFEFNEMVTQPERIKQYGYPRVVVENWFIGNSTHVIDLAFYLAAEWPKNLEGFCAAGPLWAQYHHPTLFSGAGITHSGIPFSYFANWEVPGPWLVEVQTPKRKLVLNPLEKLFIQVEGKSQPVDIDYTLDTTHRPGIYREVEHFLSGKNLPTIADQIAHFDWYDKMLENRI